MTIQDFNIRMIIISCVISIGLVFVYFSLLKECKELNWFKGNIKIFNWISLPIFAIFILAILGTAFSNLASKKDVEQRILITEIIENRGSRGLKSLTSYSIYGKTDNEEEIYVGVYVLMPIEFKTEIEKLVVGDFVYVKYTKNLNLLYFCEKIE